MTYRKGSWTDLSMICMSVFFFSFLGSVITDEINLWMFSHHAVLHCCSCCVGFPFRVLWWSTVVLWFSSPDTTLSLFVSCSVLVSVSFLNTKLLEREVCVLLWWLVAPPKNTCNTDECGERERERRVGGTSQYCVPRDPKQLGATQANANHKLRETARKHVYEKLFISHVTNKIYLSF